MNKNEFMWYIDPKTTVNDRYEYAKKMYFKRWPDGTESHFHTIESEFLNDRIKKIESDSKKTPESLALLVALRNLLRFIGDQFLKTDQPVDQKLDAPCAALYCIITGIEINKSNSKQWADQLTGKDAAHFLNTYNKFNNQWTKETGRKARNHIKRLEKIMPLLEDSKQKIAEGHIRSLEIRSEMQ